MMAYLFIGFIGFVLGCMFTRVGDRKEMYRLARRARKYRLELHHYRQK